MRFFFFAFLDEFELELLEEFELELLDELLEELLDEFELELLDEFELELFEELLDEFMLELLEEFELEFPADAVVAPAAATTRPTAEYAFQRFTCLPTTSDVFMTNHLPHVGYATTLPRCGERKVNLR